MDSTKDIRQPVPIRHLLGKFWTVANMLSLSRVVLAAPIVYIILTDGSLAWLFALVALGALTDWLDGRIARWSHTVSDWGKVLDPLADKVGTISIALALVIRGDLPLWFLALIFVRDVLIVIGGVVVTRRTGRVLMSVWVGKLAVTAVAITIIAALLKADAPILQFCIGVSTVLLVYSWAVYLIRALRTIRLGRIPEVDDVLSTSQQASLSSGSQPAQSMQ